MRRLFALNLVLLVIDHHRNYEKNLKRLTHDLVSKSCNSIHLIVVGPFWFHLQLLICYLLVISNAVIINYHPVGIFTFSLNSFPRFKCKLGSITRTGHPIISGSSIWIIFAFYHNISYNNISYDMNYYRMVH